ncbi:hypothetical protein AB0J63_26665 [Streptosporangium canum]|uniref:hypothetical protein n=1 Tax=Streptosporangium canum TaxID=324952 RepID=UPI0034176317
MMEVSFRESSRTRHGKLNREVGEIFMSTSSKKIAALAATAITALSALSVTPSATAAIQPRSTSAGCIGHIPAENGEGVGVMNKSANLKHAFYATCSNVAYLTTGTKLYFQCWWKNDYGNQWWHVRVAGTSTYGWMSSDNIDVVTVDDDGDGVTEERICEIL